MIGTGQTGRPGLVTGSLGRTAVDRDGIGLPGCLVGLKFFIEFFPFSHTRKGKNSMKNFKTYQLAIGLHKDCRGLKLSSVARDQFERAMLSIPLNLAEGAAKPTERDRMKFYFIALGSLREVQTLLALYGSPDLIGKADILGAHLYRLCHPR